MMQNIQLTTRQKVMIASVVAALIVITGFILWYMITHPIVTTAIRDISIIILAIVVIVLDIVLMILMLQIIKLIDFLLMELKPVLESLQDTSNTVRGTADFVSDGVASPVIGVAAKYAGLRQSLSTLVSGVPLRKTTTTGTAPAGGLNQEEIING